MGEVQNNQDGVQMVGVVTGLYVPQEEVAEYKAWLASKKQRRIAELKKDHEKIFEARRTTLVLRRVKKHEEIAPDEHVLAYILLYQMRDAVTDEGKKVVVADDEVKAYLDLDPEFSNAPTLDAVEARAKEMATTEE